MTCLLRITGFLLIGGGALVLLSGRFDRFASSGRGSLHWPRPSRSEWERRRWVWSF